MRKVYGEGSSNPEKKVQRTGKTVTQNTTTVTTRVKGGTVEKSTRTIQVKIYEIYVEKRSFYLKEKLIFFVRNKESINKALFYLGKLGKGLM